MIEPASRRSTADGSRSAPSNGLRRTAALVAMLNLSMFTAEIGVALASGSVSLFADSVDFLEDASITLILLIGLGWSRAARGRLGAVLSAIIMMPGLATLAMAWHRFRSGVPPEALAIGLTGVVALAVNTVCALLLVRHRSGAGSLTRAAFLSARNDTLANVAIIVAGLVTLRWPSPWPDLAVGLAVGALNAGAAWEVWEAAREERRDGAIEEIDGD